MFCFLLQKMCFVVQGINSFFIHITVFVLYYMTSLCCLWYRPCIAFFDIKRFIEYFKWTVRIMLFSFLSSITKTVLCCLFLSLIFVPEFVVFDINWPSDVIEGCLTGGTGRRYRAVCKEGLCIIKTILLHDFNLYTK